MIKKLLVANRGEIACRVIRAAREMGISTVAIFSEAEANAIHVKLADQSVLLGPGEPSESYLSISKVIDAARATGADAIHPGYGFLSERAEFAQACRDAGLIFVGPSPAAMRMLGSKSDAKALAVTNNVPIVPGMFEIGATPVQLEAAAAEIGYPIMLKASAGGGGRGMRVVRDPAAFMSELAIASDEALKGFGDGAMMVEKLVEQPRHIELQMLADSHGEVVALFERECSLQRRHQKIVEEAPSPLGNYGEKLWPAMREAAIRLLKAAGYVGAGTVEFMVDQSGENFYFLEVNARLQVEHPVTEAITGLDLVQWQLKIAAGERLELRDGLMMGDRSTITGHSIEARIVAENPEKNFMPSVGKITGWAEPKQPGVRVDTGYGPGAEVPRFYDSLLAKLIVHAESRPAAIAKLRAALLDFHILGVQTNIAYLIDLIDTEAFHAGAFDTGWLGRNFANWSPGEIPQELGDIIALPTYGAGPALAVAKPSNRVWDRSDGFRNARS